MLRAPRHSGPFCLCASVPVLSALRPSWGHPLVFPESARTRPQQASQLGHFSLSVTRGFLVPPVLTARTTCDLFFHHPPSLAAPRILITSEWRPQSSDRITERPLLSGETLCTTRTSQHKAELAAPLETSAHVRCGHETREGAWDRPCGPRAVQGPAHVQSLKRPGRCPTGASRGTETRAGGKPGCSRPRVSPWTPDSGRPVRQRKGRGRRLDRCGRAARRLTREHAHARPPAGYPLLPPHLGSAAAGAARLPPFSAAHSPATLPERRVLSFAVALACAQSICLK